MSTANASGGELHATLREVEVGLYRAEYPGEFNPEHADARELPDFHIGTSVADVKVWVEQMAIGMGYSRVVWEMLP